MTLYQHILLTTDFSEGSNQVHEKAKAIAQLMDARLSLLHVVEMISGYGYGYVGLAELEIQLLAAAKKRMAEIGRQYHIAEEHQHIEVGSTKLTISQKAEDLGVDLIVIGTHERHGVDYLLGSTASAVIQGALCDVWTVRIEPVE